MIDTESDNMATRLGLRASAQPWRRRAMALVIALAVITIIAMAFFPAGDNAPRYVTQPVQQGNLRVVVSATGTLQPTNQVQVGIEVSGTIKTVAVNYNDHVSVGQVLAQIDTTKLDAQMRQTASALEAAHARVQQAQATIRETRSRLDRLLDVRKLSGGKVPSRQELDAAEADATRALADAASARAAVTQSEATLRANQTDLAKATVRSTIDGVVLARSVEPGQTLAASFQTPVLFTLAEDLTRMELQVDVDEADVGQVRAGQRATFTVAAYPDRSFPAEVTQVRFGAQTVAGVVTYKALLRVDNAALLLLPGMTATASIAVNEVEDALLVPNAALRFSPPATVANQSNANAGLLGRLFARRGGGSTADKSRRDKGQRVFIVRDGELVAVAVTTGASDGVFTEIKATEIKSTDIKSTEMKLTEMPQRAENTEAQSPDAATKPVLNVGTAVVVDLVAPKP